MSEPRRWKHSPDAPVGMRELLGSARPLRPLDEAIFHRGARRVATFSVAPAVAGAVSVWTKLAAAGALGLVAAGTIAGVELFRDPSNDVVTTTRPVPSPSLAAASSQAIPQFEPPASIAPVRDDPPMIAAPVAAMAAPLVAKPVVAAAPVATVATTVEKPAPDASSTPWISSEPSRAKSTLDDELGLLQSAREHLARSPQMSLSELAQHRALYPSGVLATERDLMELDALRRAGYVQDAINRAQAWLARDPHGFSAARVRRILSTLE